MLTSLFVTIYYAYLALGRQYTDVNKLYTQNLVQQLLIFKVL